MLLCCLFLLVGAVFVILRLSYLCHPAILHLLRPDSKNHTVYRKHLQIEILIYYHMHLHSVYALRCRDGKIEIIRFCPVLWKMLLYSK